MGNQAADTSGVVACPSWLALLDRIAECFVGPADAFATDTLLVPSLGHGRYIAQHLSRRLGGAAGICGGIDMVTSWQLTRRLLGQPDDDPWCGSSLVTAIAGALADDPTLLRPGAAPTIDYADALARMFDDYRDRCPAMLLEWDGGRDTGPTGAPLPSTQAWQAVLWRSVGARLGVWPHPARARLLAADAVPAMTGRLGVVLVTPPSPMDRPLIHALQEAGAPVWTYRPASAKSRGRYDAQWPVALEVPAPPDDPAAPLLRRVQADIAAGRSAAGVRRPDRSVQIHASHGPSRQVEVLRDVLCAAFDELPELQPRDVLVLTSAPDTYGPLLEAAFAPDCGHPAGRLRLQVSRQRENPLVAGLIDVLELPSSRAGADDLLAWCRRPAVARCLGLAPDDHQRLEELVRQAGIVWGVDKASRDEAGVEVRTGTWLDGVQRLTLALASTRPAGTIIPPDGVEPDDAEVVGALAELVSRLRWAMLRASSPATPHDWAARLAEIARQLFVADDPWAVEALSELLTSWRDDASATPLTALDVTCLLRRELVREGRPSFGNGNLQVRKLGDLQGVAFRVICVIGLDDASFPDPLLARADDLLFDDQLDTTQLAGLGIDARRRSRVALRDALLAAGDRFIVMTKGADERTGAVLPMPVAVLDLLAMCGAEPSMVQHHSLQAHASANFTVDGGGPTSYDTHALHAARRMASDRVAQAPGWRAIATATSLHGPPADAHLPIGLDDVERFLKDPALYLLRQACDLRPSGDQDAAAPILPLELSALQRWSVGQAILDDLLAGRSEASAVARALAAPSVPPGALGRAAIQPLVNTAGRLARQVAALGPVDTVAIDLRWDDQPACRLTGAVALRGRRVVVERFGNVTAPQILACWVRLLAVTAARAVDVRQAEAWGSDQHLTLLAPEPDEARALLRRIAALAMRGASELVPLPPRTSAALVGVLGARREPEAAAEDAFAGRYGEGLSAAWQTLLGDATLAALRQVPGDFDPLSDELWGPVARALQPGGGAA